VLDFGHLQRRGDCRSQSGYEWERCLHHAFVLLLIMFVIICCCVLHWSELSLRRAASDQHSWLAGWLAGWLANG